MNYNQVLNHFKQELNLYQTVKDQDAKDLFACNQDDRLTLKNDQVYYAHDVEQFKLKLVDEIQPFTYVDAIMYLQNLK